MEVGSAFTFSLWLQFHPCGYFKLVSGRQEPLINKLQLTVIKRKKKKITI